MGFKNGEIGEVTDNVDTNNNMVTQPDNKEVIVDKKKWNTPDLKTLTKEDLKDVKKIEFVVHPLYKFLYESYSNEETADIDGDFDQILLRYFNKLCEADSKINHENVYMGDAFLTLMEMVEEIQDYMKPCPEGSIRVFFMPNISELNENQRLIMNKFLEKYGGNNIYTLNSEHSNNGIIDYNDRNFLIKNLSKEINIELQGGYMGGCLNGAIESFNDIKKQTDAMENIMTKPYIDLIPSTDPWIQSGHFSENNNEFWDNFVDKGGFKAIPQDKFPMSFNSVSDAIAWLKNSSSYKNFENSNYRKILADGYRNEFNIDAVLNEIYDSNIDSYGNVH